MDMVIAFLQLALGLGLLLLSADFLLKTIITIAEKTGIPAALITVTLVALGTSLPELVTSLIASFKGVPDISLGNIIGSNIFNLLVVIGFACCLKPLQNTFVSVKKEWFFLILATCLLWILGQDLFLTRWDGLLFLILFAIFLYSVVINHVRGDSSQDTLCQTKRKPSTASFKDWMFLILSIGGLLAGAHLVLLGAVHIGRAMGMTERLIGLTIVSVGTGLPELAASLVAALRKRHDISISNVIGSNIMNTLLITGAASLCMPLTVTRDIMKYDYFWLFGITLGLLILSIYIKAFVRILGIFLLALYFIYLLTIFY